MFNNAIRPFLLIFALLLIVPVAPLGAQDTGTVTGTVADAENGQLLDGVQVHIPALGIGVISRDGGQFTIPGVPAGTHELRAELIGHRDVIQTVTSPAAARYPWNSRWNTPCSTSRSWS